MAQVIGFRVPLIQYDLPCVKLYPQRPRFQMRSHSELLSGHEILGDTLQLAISSPLWVYFEGGVRVKGALSTWKDGTPVRLAQGLP